MDEFWVFGYGSLMWNPGFPYEEQIRARAHGFHRSLCIRSFVHRGTEAVPGLVLGLDRGGSCQGLAFRVSNETWLQTLAYLRERELVTSVYLERHLPLTLADGRRIQALGYVVDRSHHQYAGAITVEEAAAIVLRATGRSGPNRAYVENTVAHLKGMGIRDRWLERLADSLHTDI
ncbi:gamma-glutamylcyclotransferase [Allorhizobium sp. BGMRC 0089]|uniref:gamma-glutamylcyclotransferase n=1 Tax=Allorhizobium sonneratiae TaxID=2934936 RepID=UPI00203330D6|nr:gamma-glutamylcyclotransferase [Allorhizobium sonneratiae]MCM2293483.1 gamma-glutamylcyclotransferase [Allorhizobium sonneratiae]